ncbi:MAG: SpoIIE family protein phosphatase [Bacteroidota bacterium]|nr:SpoIIE family protein phosphatase [Bacteroidota bacterium]
MKFFFLNLFFLLAFSRVLAQQVNVDSLKKILLTETKPKKRINIRSLVGEYGGIERTGYWDSLIVDSKAINYLHGVTYASFMQSINYTKKGKYDKAVELAEEALLFAKKGKDTTWMGYAIEHLGSLNSYIKENQTALNYYNEALKLYEGKNLASRKGHVTVRLGEIYELDSNMTQSMSMYRTSLQSFLAISDTSGISIAYNRIGKIFKKMDKLDSALYYMQKSLEIRKGFSDEYYLCSILNDLAFVYFDLGEKETAYKYIMQSKKEAERIGDKGTGFHDINLFLFQYYKAKKEYQLALYYKEITDSIKDVLDNEGNDKAILRQQAKYIYDKQTELDEIQNSKLIAIEREEKEKQQVIIYSICGGLLLVIVFSGFIYNRFKITQKQKKIIEIKEQEAQYQKHLVEEKHKEITDSINYAERIQRSFLATKEQLDNNLKEYFVFFQPKDVVSGDFYWASTLKNGNFALVTADSTGHGVPGAIMSLLNTSSLEKAVESGVYEPSEILNHTRKTIIERLKKDGSTEGGKDGMDCSLLSLNTDKNKLTYAAANNPVWIVRTSANFTQNELIELKPDKIPVGKHDRDTISFTQHEVELQKGDMIYVLTDGFPDQFGGPKAKKFMYKKLKETLVSISEKPLNEQDNILRSVLKVWMEGSEQVDDITLIGIRV